MIVRQVTSNNDEIISDMKEAKDTREMQSWGTAASAQGEEGGFLREARAVMEDTKLLGNTR